MVLLIPLILVGPTVWVVDPLMLPGAHFSDVQAAVDAAADGDVILMRFGGYSGFAIDGKSLTLAEDELLGFGATVFGPIEVRNLAADQEVVIRGLDLELADASAPDRQLLIESCQGQVLLHDMTLTRGAPCVEVNIGQVTLSDCTLTGSSNDPVLQEPVGAGLVASFSSVNLYDCAIAGGDGADDVPPTHAGLPDAGGDAVRLSQSTVFAAGSTVQGGDGGDGADGQLGGCSNGAIGGNGVRILDASSGVTLLDTTVAGGQGGAPGTAACSQGADGAVFGPFTGGISSDTGTARHLAVNSPVREGEVVVVDIQGGIGELSILLISDEQVGFPFDPNIHGVLVAHPALTVFVGIGLTNPSGALRASFPFAVGKLPPGLEARSHVLQAAMIDLFTLDVRLTAPAPVLLLDSLL